MKWIARVLVFIGAFVCATFVASLFWNDSWQEVPAAGLLQQTTPTAAGENPLRAEDLLGTWKGNWGRNGGDCTIAIDRIDGKAFYGTLRKEGAEIRFEGTFDPKSRMIYFDETKVVRLGAHMSEWSLGKNRGIISQDGQILAGSGHDSWGQYSWAASNY